MYEHPAMGCQRELAIPPELLRQDDTRNYGRQSTKISKKRRDNKNAP
jgi:hypothetical protein